MKLSMLCPACLTQLPDDYPYDHVAIDRVLTTEPERLVTMNRHEQREVILTGLARCISITALAAHLQQSTRHLRALLPAEHPESAVNARHRRTADRDDLDSTVRALWERGLPDTEISLQTGHSVYAIGGVRRRLGLATLNHRQRWLLPGGTR